MAAVYIPTIKAGGATPHVVEPNELSDSFAFTTVSDSTNGAYLARTYDASNNVTAEFKDAKTNILFYNTSTSDVDVVVKAGDAYAACNDLAVKVKGQKYHFMQIDSAYFKVVSGGVGDSTAVEKAIHIIPSASVGVALIENR